MTPHASHAWPKCQVCGAAFDDPEAAEYCAPSASSAVRPCGPDWFCGSCPDCLSTPEHRPPNRALLKLNRVYSGGKVTMDADAFDALTLGDDA